MYYHKSERVTQSTSPPQTDRNTSHAKTCARVLSLRQAWLDIRDLRTVWSTILPTWNVLDRAEDLMGAFSLSFWDALILAACLENGVNRLYTEDFDAYPTVNGLEVINPFAKTS